MDKKKICFITARAGTASSFLKNQMGALSKDYEVHFISNEKDHHKIDVKHDQYCFIDIHREISIIKDISAVFKLYRYFRREHFTSVHSVTPKAGLLTALAAFFARVPVRIHTFTGQVWANKKGLMRLLLKTTDRIIALLDNHVLVDGKSQRRYLIEQKIIKENKSRVLGEGSICGVDVAKFQPSFTIRSQKREEVGIDADIIVFEFMGRLNHDKGTYDLLEAFNELCENNNNLFLLLIGRDEENVSEHFSEYKNLNTNNFLYYGSTSEPEITLQIGDVFVLPTYREGFGMSVIEAQSLGLPVICSDAYGVMDAMVDDVTGLRFPIGDTKKLVKCMESLLGDKSLREKMGRAGRERVIKFFNSQYMTDLWCHFYSEVLGSL